MIDDKEQSKMAVPSGTGGISAAGLDSQMAVPLREQSTPNIRDYVSILFKHKRALAGSFAVILALFALYPLLIYKPKYQARSVVLVKFGWETFAPDLLPDNGRGAQVVQSEQIQSEVGIMNSREVKERAVGVLKPESVFPELARKSFPGLTNAEAACYIIEKDLVVTPDKGNTIMVAFAGQSAERASALVNQLVDSYIDRRNEIYKDPKSEIFLSRKADEYARKLADAESRLQAFRVSTNIISFDEQKSLLLKQQYDMEHVRAVAEDEKKGILDKIAEIQNQENSIPKFSQTSESALSYRVQATEQKILELQLMERELAARYKDDNKLLIGVREQLKIASDFLDNQRKTRPAEVLDPVWKDLQRLEFSARADLQALIAKIESTDQMLTDLNAQLQSFEDLQQKNKALVREVADNAEKYRSYKQKMEESKVTDELNRQKMTSVSVIERASPSNIPTNPFRPLFMLIPVVLVIAVVGSVGFAFLMELLSQGLSTPSEAEKRLDLPVLATISAK